MVKIETFKKILNKTQSELKETMTKYLEEVGYKPIVGDGFVYAKGTIPILLVAHLDTVHLTRPTEIYYDEEQKVMWSPQGIGGDDRCGVYIISKLLNNFHPYVLFTEDEEKGAIGAGKVVETLNKPNVKFIIEIDRRGADDCVFYDCGNKEFQEYIESFGFKTAIGSFSDICTLSDAWDIASVNLSSGYHDEHTKSETINTDEVENTYKRVKEILFDDKENDKYFDYQKVEYTSKFQSSGSFKKVYEDDWGYTDENGVYHWWDDEYGYTNNNGLYL